MPYLIAPGSGEMQLGQVEFTVPPAMRRDLTINAHLRNDFLAMVHRVLQQSFNDPRTRPLIATSDMGRMIKERADLIWKVCIVMRRDLGYTLQQTMDELYNKFFEALQRGERTEDMIERETEKGKWDPAGGVDPTLRPLDGGPDISSAVQEGLDGALTHGGAADPIEAAEQVAEDDQILEELPDPDPDE